MPIHEAIMPDGSIGYQWGTKGKVYKRKQDAERQARAILASGWREHKDQTVSHKSLSNASTTKSASYMQDDPATLIDRGAKYSMDPEELFRLQHLQSLVGDQAVSLKQQINYSKWAPSQIALALGATVGGLYGYNPNSSDPTTGVTVNALKGAGVGQLAALASHAIGNFAGSATVKDRGELRKDLLDLGATGFALMPGRGSYLKAQLDMDYDNWRTKQKNWYRGIK